jgi:hypothetical protein
MKTLSVCDVIQADRCCFLEEIKGLLRSSGVVYVDKRMHEDRIPNFFIAAEKYRYMEDPTWRLEVWITTKGFISSSLDDEELIEAHSVNNMIKILQQLQFKYEDTFDYGSGMDVIFVLDDVNMEKAANVIFELLCMCDLLLYGDSYEGVDLTFVRRAECLKLSKRKIVEAYAKALLSDIEAGLLEKNGERTRAGIAPYLGIRRQAVYYYSKDFEDLCLDGFLVKTPYKGPGMKRRSYLYKLNCNPSTAKAIIDDDKTSIQKLNEKVD